MTASWWKMEWYTEAGSAFERRNSPSAENVPGDSQRAGAQHDWNNVLFLGEHSDKRQYA